LSLFSALVHEAQKDAFKEMHPMTTSKFSLLAGILLLSAAAHADCPEGGRPTTAAEQQLDIEATSTISSGPDGLV
jgi:hypothetical protein